MHGPRSELIMGLSLDSYLQMCGVDVDCTPEQTDRDAQAGKPGETDQKKRFPMESAGEADLQHAESSV